MIYKTGKQAEIQTVSEYTAQLKKLSKACKLANADIIKEFFFDYRPFNKDQSRFIVCLIAFVFL